jgi:hypothetical protein
MCLSGSVAAQSLQYGGIQEVSSLKRGKEYSIRWFGGAKEQKINITLLNRSGERVQSWTDLVNDGEHTLKLGPRLKPQAGYVLDITIAGENNGVISSSDIRIRRRIPLAVTISTLVIVPLAVMVFIPDGSTEEMVDTPTHPPQ